jgi:hypothetical protein
MAPWAYFAIRRRSDGAFLPQSSRRRHGFTSDEPTLDRPPRLFTTRHAADVALTWWKRGVDEGDWEEDWRTDERKSADMEVVVLSLVIPEEGDCDGDL